MISRKCAPLLGHARIDTRQVYTSIRPPQLKRGVVLRSQADGPARPGHYTSNTYDQPIGRGHLALRAEFHGTWPQNWPCHEIPRNRLNNLGHPEPGSKFRSVLSVRICTRIPWPLWLLGRLIGTEDLR